MKKRFLALWLPLTLLACSSQNDTPAPDAGTAIAGEYAISRNAKFTNSDTDYDYLFPQTTGNTTVSGTLVVTRGTATAVYVAVVQQVKQVSGVSSATTTFGRMDIKTTASGYELSQFNNNQQTGSGTANGSVMSIELRDTYVPTMTTTRYVVEAKR